MKRKTTRGRGSPLRPEQRFTTLRTEYDDELFEHDPEALEVFENPATQFLPDASRTIVTENNSPDVPFRYSVNPYRGCEHGCAYCYARPGHEYLGLNAGIDFETRIFVKHEAPALLREWLGRERWKPEVIVFSGVTDCYQPAERRFRLTRGCLEVAAESAQPVGIITKNALVTRDIDLLQRMAAENTVHVNISITTLDAGLARRLEPRTSSPDARLRAIRMLTEVGVPVRVMVAPVIPGLNDSEIPSILEAAAHAGAKSAGFVLLRLPFSVKPVFLDWLERMEPTRAPRILSRIRATRGGGMNDPQFGSRMRGNGVIADQIAATFRLFTRRYGLDGPLPEPDTSRFRPPRPVSGQLRLF